MRVGDGSLELLDAAAQDEEEAVDELALAHKHSAGEARVWRLLVLVELDGGEEPHELLDLRGGEVAKAGERGQEGGEARVCRSAACPKPTSQVVRRHGHFAVGGCVDVAISELAPTVAQVPLRDDALAGARKERCVESRRHVRLRAVIAVHLLEGLVLCVSDAPRRNEDHGQLRLLRRGERALDVHQEGLPSRVGRALLREVQNELLVGRLVVGRRLQFPAASHEARSESGRIAVRRGAEGRAKAHGKTALALTGIAHAEGRPDIRACRCNLVAQVDLRNGWPRLGLRGGLIITCSSRVRIRSLRNGSLQFH